MMNKKMELSSWRSVVANKRWMLSLLATATMAAFAGCGGSSTASVQNPPPPPQSNVTIAVQTSGLANGSVPVNGTVSLTATLQGTAAQVSAGVAWTLTCQADPDNKNGLCGTLSSTYSASGATIAYTAPAS